MSTSFSKKQWATDVLVRLYGIVNPNPLLVAFLWGWQQAESGASDVSGADYNPLNTTLKWPGSTDFNSVGVQNYPTYAAGLLATQQTLNNGLYPSLKEIFSNDDPSSLGGPGVANDLTMWVSGKKTPYATQYINLVFECGAERLKDITGGIDIVVQTNGVGTVLDIIKSYQLETGESQDLCGPWSVASLSFAGLPGKGSRGSAEQIDQLADKWADQFLSGGHVGALGSEVPDMYNFMTASIDPVSAKRNLHWWDLGTPSVDNIRKAVKAGYPVLITVNEQNIKEKSTGKQPPYPWNLNANHIIPVAGIDKDGDFICVDQLNNSFQGYWPVTYVASLLNPLWATVVQVVGPDDTKPWLKPIPSNDPNNWPAGFDAQNFGAPTPPAPEYWKEQAMAIWNGSSSPVFLNNAILTAWLNEYKTNFMGIPVSEEIKTVDWDGNPIRVRFFSNGKHAEWNEKDGHTRLYDANNTMYKEY